MRARRQPTRGCAIFEVVKQASIGTEPVEIARAAEAAGCCCKLLGRGGVRQCWLRFLAATSQITLSAAKKGAASCDPWSKSSWPRISETTASALSNLPDRASLCA